MEEVTTTSFKRLFMNSLDWGCPATPHCNRDEERETGPEIWMRKYVGGLLASTKQPGFMRTSGRSASSEALPGFGAEAVEFDTENRSFPELDR